MNRDLIGEKGGINLFALTRSDPLNLVDPLGLCWYKPWKWNWRWPPWSEDDEPGPIDGAIETIRDNVPDVTKEILKERAEQPAGKRTPPPSSPGAGMAGNVGGGILQGLLALLEIGPQATQSIKMGIDNKKVTDKFVNADNYDGPSFIEELNARERRAEACQDTGKKLDQ
jgi:hypothetical protein